MKEGKPVTQEHVDRTCMERLHWAGRFASAVAHDLGNVILYSTATELDQPTLSDELRTCLEQKAELTAHLRDFAGVMDVWRKQDTHGPVMCSLRQFWSMHGCMLRQFVTPPTRMSLAKASDELMVEAVRTARVIASMVTAIDIQMPRLERIEVNIERGEGSRVAAWFSGEPAGRAGMLIPALARELSETASAEQAGGGALARLELRTRTLESAELE